MISARDQRQKLIKMVYHIPPCS
uniref:Uncharacterized protein n=1 Tax=Arundo donax TaxID=35708 RepID=A0A0A9A374_ARUDO